MRTKYSSRNSVQQRWKFIGNIRADRNSLFRQSPKQNLGHLKTTIYANTKELLAQVHGNISSYVKIEPAIGRKATR